MTVQFFKTSRSNVVYCFNRLGKIAAVRVKSEKEGVKITNQSATNITCEPRMLHDNR
jgi:hypothetical protein